MKQLQTILIIFFTCLTLNSCSEDNDDNSVNPPSDFYYTGDQPIPFYTNGSTGTPNINWGNETGTFTLNDNYTGVSIDNITGILSWNEDLPLGDNFIGVTATNSAGFATTTVLFLHQFSGQFDGGHNTNPSSTVVNDSNLQANFNVDGTMTITDNGNSGSGSWQFNPSGKLICNYTVNTTTYELELDLTYSINIIPYLEGYKRIMGSTSNIGFVRLDYQQ